MAYRDSPDHNPENYLKTILEAMDHHNYGERLDMALWLHEGYKKAKEKPSAKATTKAFILELMSKFIQELEDLAVLCLMFAGSEIRYQGKPIVEKSKLPFETYTFISNQKILQFYSVVKKGLSRKAVAKIYAYKSAHELYREGVINRTEVPYFSTEIDKLYVAACENLNKIGSLYSGRKKYGSGLSYGKLVEIYFKTKHGFKVLHTSPTSKLLWSFEDTDIALVSGISSLKNGRKVMELGFIKQFSDEDEHLLIQRIEGWSKVIHEIVLAHLHSIENANYMVSLIRKLKSEKLIHAKSLKVGRNDMCLCGSEIKYKKCCGSMQQVNRS